MTRAATALETYLNGQFSPLVFQRFNCRPIAGTSIWSQHAWPGDNARDIFGPPWLLDKVAAHLKTYRLVFGIRTVLWRVSGHYDHVHADMWPTGYSKPPCSGAVERYRYSSGRIVQAFGGDVTPEGSLPLVVSDTMIVRQGETGPYVAVYQQALNGWAVKQQVPGWVPLTVDGAFGPLMAAGVARYQDAAGLTGKVPLRGGLDDLTRDLLERYVEA